MALIYDIPGLPPLETTNVEGLPQIRSGQNIPLSNDEWFDWVPKVKHHRFRVYEETTEKSSKRDQYRQREIERVLADERYWFYTYPGIYEARSEAEEVSVVEATEEAATGGSRGGFLPYILYPFQDYWITWQRLALRTRGPKGDTITIKSRDMGASNTAVGMLAYRWLTRAVFQGRVLSRVEELVDDTADPDSLFWKLDAMLRTSPRWMLEAFIPGFNWEMHRRHMTLENPRNRNVLKGESTNASAGRGKRATIIMLDEFPFMEKFKAIWRNTRPSTYHRIAVGSVSTQKGMDAYNLVESGRPAIIRLDSRTGMHPMQDARWHELERARDDPEAYDQEVGMDWFADAADFVYPIFSRKETTDAPYLPFAGPVFGTIDDGYHWAIWLWQYIKATGDIHVFACYRNKGKRTNYYGAAMRGLYLNGETYDERDKAFVDIMRYVKVDHWCGDAHAANWEQGSGTSVVDDLASEWGIYLNIDWRKRQYEDRRKDTEEVARYMKFHAGWPWMDEGLRALAMYKYPDTREGKERGIEPRAPLHNDDSHYATSLERGCCLFDALKDEWLNDDDMIWVGDPAV